MIVEAHERRLPKSAITTFVAGFGLLIPAAAGLGLMGLPAEMSPLPGLTTIPLFVFSVWRLERIVIIMVPVLLFFAWHPGLFRGDTKVPRRSYALLTVATVLSVIYFVGSWKWGLQYQGVAYTRLVCGVNFAWIVLLFFGFARAWQRKPSFKFSLLLHWMLFAWLAWYAFPYLGELL